MKTALAFMTVALGLVGQSARAEVATPAASSIFVVETCAGEQPTEPVQPALANLTALQRIRLAQEGAAFQTALTFASRRAIEPAVEPVQTKHCPRSAVGEHALFPNHTKPNFGIVMAGGDFLASRLIAVRHTTLDAKWAGVSSSITPATAHRLISVTGNQAEILEAVNTWVNRHITYVEDKTLDGVSDSWSPASVTLSRRKGDCEDIAILKMRLLTALGFKGEVFFTVARDTARAADHALLVAKVNGRPLLLDSATDELLDGLESHDYRPIASFAGERRWIHGYALSAGVIAATPIPQT